MSQLDLYVFTAFVIVVGGALVVDFYKLELKSFVERVREAWVDSKIKDELL